VVVAVALIAGPAVDGFESWHEYGDSELSEDSAPVISISDKRDVFLVVLDGFPGLETISSELDASFSSEFRSALDAEEFQVPSARSAYASTNYSVPSILAMGYPLTQPPSNDRTLQDLYDIVSGANPVRESLQEAGYTTHMVEYGWSGSSCVSHYD
jgi:hypothetical protein